MGATSLLSVFEFIEAEGIESFEQSDGPFWMRGKHYETSKRASDLLDRGIQADPNLSGLSKTGLHLGNAWIRLQTHHIRQWILRRILEHGAQSTHKELLTYVSLDHNPAWQILAITGLKISQPVSLPDGMELVPLENLPPGTTKDSLLELQRLSHATSLPMPYVEMFSAPSCALMVPAKIRPKHEPPEKPLLWEPLSDFLLCVTAAGSHTPLSHLFWFDLHPSVPGSITASAVGHKIQDVAWNPDKRISSLRLKRIYDFYYSHWKTRTEQERASLRIVLSRISQASRRRSVPDKALDLGIALEALILKGTQVDSPIKFNLRLRVSRLLGRSFVSRKQYFEFIGTLYDLRSKVAHGNEPAGDLKVNGRAYTTDEFLNVAIRIAKRISQIVIRNGFPDWDRIILDKA